MRNLTRLACLGMAAAAITVGSGAAAQREFTPPRATEYSQVTSWPDFTGVWNPDWSILFGEGGRREVEPKLTPAGQAEFDAFQQKQEAEGVDQHFQVNCIPPGMPNIMRQPYPVEFLFSPDRVTIFAETYSQARRIYIDGRPVPEDPDLLFNGTSVGRWEGDTLVVDTVGFSPITQIAPGVGHSEQMRLQERMWLQAPDVLRIETTITDPEVLAEPLVQQLAFRKQPDWQIREYICEENNRLRSEEGGANIDLGLDSEGEGEDPFGPPPEPEN